MMAFGWSVAIAAHSMPGESETGDQSIVQVFSGGILMAVIDGLGHGPEAASAATIAGGVLQNYAYEPPSSLVGRCHQALVRTRGVVMSLASFNGPTQSLTWLGIGNVQGIVVRESGPMLLICQDGVVGGPMPRLRPSTIAIKRGDTLIFATDGVRSEFTQGLKPSAVLPEPERLAREILTSFSRAGDDALVLVARYLGGQ